MLSAIAWTTVSMTRAPSICCDGGRGRSARRRGLPFGRPEELDRERGELIRLDRVAHPLHQLLVIAEVVDRVQARREDLAAAIQMMQIGPRIIPARIARAFGIERRRIIAMLRVADAYHAFAREQMPVARVARR